jgi:hypothetical protein
MGFCGSTTFPDKGSDLHRVCLSRLRCAFRLSQPLDAFIPPLTSRPCFVPVTPLSFRLQRVPPPDSRFTSRCRLPLLPLRARLALKKRLGAPTSGIEAFGRSVRCGRFYPVTAGRASPDLLPFEGFPLRASTSCFHRSTFMGFDMTPDRSPSSRLLCKVSKNPKVGLPLSRAASLLELFSPRRHPVADACVPFRVFASIGCQSPEASATSRSWCLVQSSFPLLYRLMGLTIPLCR